MKRAAPSNAKVEQSARQWARSVYGLVPVGSEPGHTVKSVLSAIVDGTANADGIDVRDVVREEWVHLRSTGDSVWSSTIEQWIVAVVYSRKEPKKVFAVHTLSTSFDVEYAHDVLCYHDVGGGGTELEVSAGMSLWAARGLRFIHEGSCVSREQVASLCRLHDDDPTDLFDDGVDTRCYYCVCCDAWCMESEPCDHWELQELMHQYQHGVGVWVDDQNVCAHVLACDVERDATLVLCEAGKKERQTMAVDDFVKRFGICPASWIDRDTFEKESAHESHRP